MPATARYASTGCAASRPARDGVRLATLWDPRARARWWWVRRTDRARAVRLAAPTTPARLRPATEANDSNARGSSEAKPCVARADARTALRRSRRVATGLASALRSKRRYASLM